MKWLSISRPADCSDT